MNEMQSYSGQPSIGFYNQKRVLFIEEVLVENQKERNNIVIDRRQKIRKENETIGS